MSIQNLSYEDLPFEKWVALPNMDEYFYISNFGRVKSVDRSIQDSKGFTRFYRGRIYKPVISKYYNSAIHEYTYEMKVGIYYLGKRFNIRVARMVYELFIEPITIDKKNHLVSFKNRDNLDIRPENLILISHNEKMKKIYELNRCIPVYNFRKEDTSKKIAEARCISITQFSLEGKRINEYRSIKDAAKATGLDTSGIVAALKKKKTASCGGFIWLYGKINHDIDTTFYYQFINKSGFKNQFTKMLEFIDLSNN